MMMMRMMIRMRMMLNSCTVGFHPQTLKLEQNCMQVSVRVGRNGCSSSSRN